MTRPLSNTVQYFPHTTEHGKTMFILENRFPDHGYRFWFKLLEVLGKTENHFIDITDSMELENLQAYTKSPDDITTSNILALLAKLQAINPDLWKKGLIWSENFVLGLKQVYDNRKRKLPEKPDVMGRKDVFIGSYPDYQRITTGNLLPEIPQGRKEGRKVLKEGNKGTESLDPDCGKNKAQIIWNMLEVKIKHHRPNHQIITGAKATEQIRLLFEKDKRDPEMTKTLIEWYPIGEEYIPEIFSAKALREKYDKLLNAYHRAQKATDPKNNLTPGQKAVLESERKAREREQQQDDNLPEVTF